MRKFSEVAKEAMASSFVMAGREERKNEYMLSAYPNGFTIVAAENVAITSKDGKPAIMPVYQIKEDNDIYCKGGSALAKIFGEWAALYDGDYAAMSDALKKDGGCKVKLHTTRLANGNNYTVVDVLD